MKHYNIHSEPSESGQPRETPQNEAERQGSSASVKNSKIGAEELATIERRGFDLLGDTYDKEVDTHYLFLQHRQSGATIALVQNQDSHLTRKIHKA